MRKVAWIASTSAIPTGTVGRTNPASAPLTRTLTLLLLLMDVPFFGPRKLGIGLTCRPNSATRVEIAPGAVRHLTPAQVREYPCLGWVTREKLDGGAQMILSAEAGVHYSGWAKMLSRPVHGNERPGWN